MTQKGFLKFKIKSGFVHFKFTIWVVLKWNYSELIEYHKTLLDVNLG